ncbi:MAG: hypothetical protein L0346_15145 [Chloroflexi bacterium]|nr:hypothetical protein [Chloroflexota bacterium]
MAGVSAVGQRRVGGRWRAPVATKGQVAGRAAKEKGPWAGLPLAIGQQAVAAQVVGVEVVQPVRPARRALYPQGNGLAGQAVGGPLHGYGRQLLPQRHVVKEQPAVHLVHRHLQPDVRCPGRGGNLPPSPATFFLLLRKGPKISTKSEVKDVGRNGI